MLVLQRKVGESLFIGDDIEITVVSLEAGRVRLAVEAPRELSILRSELRSAIDANRESVTEDTIPKELLQFLGEMIEEVNKDEP